MQRLTAEETLLVKIRKNVEVKLLCRTHYDAFLTKFGFFAEKFCSDPYKLHKKRATNSLSEITMEMFVQDNAFIPGRKICRNCKDKIRQKMEDTLTEQGGGGEDLGGGGEDLGGGGEDLGGGGEDLSGGEESQQSQTSSTSHHPWSQEFNEEQGLNKVNMALGLLDISPLKKSQITNNSRLDMKLKSVSESIRKHLNVGPSAPDKTDTDGFSESLCTRFQTAPDRNEKYKILTSCPANWTAWRIAKTFSCSYTMAKDALNLRKIFGPGCSPGLKQGNKIPADVILKVQDFYKAQDISRELPGQRDCLSVKVGNVREMRQKRLLLLGLREAYAQFKEDYPLCSIGFSTFASLRPKEVVLPGAYIYILLT